MDIKKIGTAIYLVLTFLFVSVISAMAASPTAPLDVASKTHTPLVPSTKKTIDVVWTASTDSDGDLKGYAVSLDNNPESNPVTVTHISVTSAKFENVVDGNWYFHITAVDDMGNYSVAGDSETSDPTFGDAVDIGPFIIDTMPNVSSVEPSSGTSGDSITITGTDFMSEATVKIGDTSVSTVRFVSSTELEAIVPAEISSGKYDITVTNPNDKSGKKEDCFSVSSVEVNAGSDKEITVGGNDPDFSDAEVSGTDENATYIYEWTVNVDPPTAEVGTDYILGSTTSQTPTTLSFKAETNNAAGSYTLKLSVKDGTTGEILGSDTLTITVYMLGDINDDGSLDVADAIMGLKVLADMDVSGIPHRRAATGPVIGMAEVIYILVETSK